MLDYILIRAWGQYTELPNSIINDELATAREDKAPGNVIYKDTDGRWVAIDQIKNSTTRMSVERIAAAIQKRHNPRHPDVPPREII